MLTCSCPTSGYDDIAWWYETPKDYSVLSTKRSRKCKSCGERIAVGDLVAEFLRWRESNSDMELKILGEGAEVTLATWYLCESCADQMFNLTELGFCVSPEDDVRETLAEYVEMVKHAKTTRTDKLA